MERWRRPPDPELTEFPPADWWGRYGARASGDLSLVDLVRLGSVDAATAAFLWIALEQRASVIVAAREHGAGKTTLLTALADLLPAGTTCYYLRGWYERFAFASELDPHRTYLLVNEISDHLPIYLWGKGVRRLFALLAAGWRLGATVHAQGADEVFALLNSFPLEVPAEHLVALDLVVTLGMGVTSEGLLRRVVRVEAIGAPESRPAIRLLALRETLRSPLAVYPSVFLETLHDRFGLPVEVASRELARRQRRIARWVAEGLRGRDAFRIALAAERRQSTEGVDGLLAGSSIDEALHHDEVDQLGTTIEEPTWRDHER